MSQQIEAIYRRESGKVRATLIRLLKSFELAEEAVHDAFAAAAIQWPRDGMPTNPSAWLVSVGRFRTIDRLRQRSRFDASLDKYAIDLEDHEDEPMELDNEMLADDQLRLIFTCCHPALPPDAQLALTLREVCGLTTEEIARAFLGTTPAIAQRIVRAKAKIRDAKIPYEVPAPADLPDRLDSVLRVIYLLFNEGYSASSGTSITRQDLSGEAIRLGRLLADLLPDAEVIGLLALILLTEARRPARTSADGEMILLADQNRGLWDGALIADGLALVERGRLAPEIGPYAIQAAIAAVHDSVPEAAATDWARIASLYDLLMIADPSPVVTLNRAVAIAMRDGPAAGITLIDALFAKGELLDYHLAHAARADLCRRLGRNAEARASYERALSLTQQGPERRFLERRIGELADQ